MSRLLEQHAEALRHLAAGLTAPALAKEMDITTEKARALAQSLWTSGFVRRGVRNGEVIWFVPMTEHERQIGEAPTP